MLNARTRAALFVLAALFLFTAPTLAQIEPAKAAPAIVTGRVTDGKRALPGIVVTLLPNGPPNRTQNMPSAKTDIEGRYRMDGVAPGSYRIVPVAPAHVTTETSDIPFGRTLMLNPGETVENIDFRLTRGGVITGRVTGSDGKPVIGEMVQLTPEDNTQPFARMFMGGGDRNQLMTDDRGVYRIYGLTAGRYRVSVGTGGARGPRRAGTGSGGTQTFYQRTFYPGVTDEAQAKLVEVTAGSETTDIDITLEKMTRQTYSVAGRFVFAETGQPGANMRVGFAPAGRGGGVAGGGFVNFGGGGPGGIFTDARGEFKMEGLASGRYFLFANREGNPDWYSEQVAFEVADADVEGVEVKLRRGASVSGRVQIEGVSDPATAARLLNGVRVFARMNNPGEMATPAASSSQVVAPDGSFRFGGLRAGQLTLLMSGMENGLMLVRVEQGGAVSPRGSIIEVAEGAQVTGVRVVVAHGKAVVRGQVNVTGGPLPDGWQVVVNARRISGDGQSAGGRGSPVDSRRRFIMENMVAGEYEFQAMAYPVGGRGGGGPGNRGGGPGGGGGSAANSRAMGIPQRVILSESGEQNITLVLELLSGVNQ